MVVDPADGGVMAWGIGDVAADLTPLGPGHVVSR
jgi:hypothetical protein